MHLQRRALSFRALSFLPVLYGDEQSRNFSTNEDKHAQLGITLDRKSHFRKILAIRAGRTTANAEQDRLAHLGILEGSLNLCMRKIYVWVFRISTRGTNRKLRASASAFRYAGNQRAVTEVFLWE